MKKSLLFILCTALITALVFTSCEQQETITTDITEETINLENITNNLQSRSDEERTAKLLLPRQYNEASAEEVAKYVARLSDEEIAQREESYKIYTYLGTTGQLDRLVQDNPGFDILTAEHLHEYAPDQAAEYQSFVNDPIELFCITLFDECIFGFLQIKGELCCYATIIPPGLECRVVVSVNIGC